MRCYLVQKVYQKQKYDNSCYLRIINENNVLLFKVYKTLKNGEPNPLFNKVINLPLDRDITFSVNHYFKDGQERVYLIDVNYNNK